MKQEYDNYFVQLLIETFSFLDKLLADKKAEVEETEKKLQVLKAQYDKFKVMLSQTQNARSKRLKNPTTFESISNTNNSTRYRRRQETKDILVYIHGSEEGAVWGAWDFIAAHASQEIINKLVSSYRRGKYLEGIFGKSIKDFNTSQDALKQAVALKYQTTCLEENSVLFVRPRPLYTMLIKKYGCQGT